MKLTICFSLVFVTAAICDHTTSVDNKTHDENHVKSSHRTDQDEFDAFRLDEAQKLSDNRRSTQKRIPAIRRVVPVDDRDHLHKERSHTHSNDVGKQSNEYEKFELHREHSSDEENNQVHYDLEDYAEEHNQPSSHPPLVLYAPQQPNIRRELQIHVPVFRRPTYARVYNVAPVPVSYRSLNPLNFQAPRVPVRNILVGYQSPPGVGSVRYAYSAPSNSYDNGIYPIDYGFIDDGYDGFLKKK